MANMRTILIGITIWRVVVMFEQVISGVQQCAAEAFDLYEYYGSTFEVIRYIVFDPKCRSIAFKAAKAGSILAGSIFGKRHLNLRVVIFAMLTVATTGDGMLRIGNIGDVVAGAGNLLWPNKKKVNRGDNGRFKKV